MHHVSFRNIQQRGAVFAAGNKNWYVYPDYYVKNIKIHDCTFENCGKDLTDETLGNLNIAQLENSEIYNLKISDTEGYGIKFIFDGYFRNLKIHDCEISLNETDSKWGEDISIELWNVGPGNEIYNIQCNTWISVVNHAEIFGSPVGCENMKIYNVRMTDKDGSGNIEGIEIGAPGVEVSDVYIENKGFGFAIWDMGRENILLHHNIIYNSSIKNNWAGAPAIYIDNSRTWNYKNIRIYNNIFDLHPVGIRIKGNNIGEIEIKNNIFLNSGKEVESTASRVIFSHNLRNGRNSSDWILTGQFETSGNLISDPGFLQSGNRWESFYKPSGSSATVDKGTNVGLPFKGNNPDIGKWEYEN
jgi:hypothetical protein